MRCLGPKAIIAAYLIIAVSIQQSFFSQEAPKPSLPKPNAPPQRQSKRPQRADALAAAINELLKLEPLAPGYEAENDSLDDSSEVEEKPPADDAPIKDLVTYWTERNGDARLNAQKPSDKVRQRLLEAAEDRPELVVTLIYKESRWYAERDKRFESLSRKKSQEAIETMRPWRSGVNFHLAESEE